MAICAAGMQYGKADSGLNIAVGDEDKCWRREGGREGGKERGKEGGTVDAFVSVW